MSRRGNASSSSSSSSSSSGDAKSGGDAKEAAETTRKMDKLYEYDEAYAQAQDDKHPWTKDINHFKSCKVSALASMKMLKHALIGVESGRKKTGMSVEVMGLLIGKLDGDCLVILDSAALPIEGENNFVESGDKVNVFMVTMMESLEKRRKEGFVGWYHSHPFDVGVHSNCFFSNTDVQMQTTFQMSMPYWVGIVVDPLRSIAKQVPEFSAFRCYPPSAAKGEKTPDGVVPEDKEAAIARWGHSYYNYYELAIEPFMSSLASNFLNIMSRNSLWIRTLSTSAATEQETVEQFPKRIGKAVQGLEDDAKSRGGGGGGGYGSSSLFPSRKKEVSALSENVQACSELAIEQCQSQSAQIGKFVLFNALDGQSKPQSDDEQ